MKIPRDLNGNEFAKRLQRYVHVPHHQDWQSHYFEDITKRHSLSVPNHKPLKLGTLNALFNAIADHLELDKQKVIEHLLSRR